MWRLKNCPKCHGDTFIEWDVETGEFCEVCLQCSYRRYPWSRAARMTVRRRRRPSNRNLSLVH